MNRRRTVFAAACVLIAAAAVFSVFKLWGKMSASGAEKVELVILMYHSLREDQTYLGKYVVSPETFEEDLIYLKEHGYTSVSVAELIAYVSDPEATLPEKPVLITFDDGHYNNYTYAYPLLEKYGFKALISVVGAYCEKQAVSGDRQSSGYSYLNWEQVAELADSGLIEIGCHSYDMHTTAAGKRYGAKQKTGESDIVYEEALKQDTLKLMGLLEENGVAMSPVYAYPFGSYNANSEEVLHALGFMMTLSCEEGTNVLTRGGSLYLLKRYNRPNGPTSEEFFRRIGLD